MKLYKQNKGFSGPKIPLPEVRELKKRIEISPIRLLMAIFIQILPSLVKMLLTNFRYRLNMITVSIYLIL